MEYTIFLFSLIMALGVYAYGASQNNPSFKLLSFAILVLMGVFAWNGTAFQTSVYTITNNDAGSVITTSYADVKTSFTDGIALIIFSIGLVGGFLESLAFYNLMSSARTRAYGGA